MFRNSHRFYLMEFLKRWLPWQLSVHLVCNDEMIALFLLHAVCNYCIITSTSLSIPSVLNESIYLSIRENRSCLSASLQTPSVPDGDEGSSRSSPAALQHVRWWCLWRLSVVLVITQSCRSSWRRFSNHLRNLMMSTKWCEHLEWTTPIKNVGYLKKTSDLVKSWGSHGLS